MDDLSKQNRIEKILPIPAKYANECIITLNKKKEIIDINDKGSELCGYQLPEIKSKPLKFLFSNFNSQIICDSWEKKSTKVKNIELVRKDGTGLYVNMLVKTNNVRKILVILKKISEDPLDSKKLLSQVQKELDKNKRVIAIQTILLTAKDELLIELQNELNLVDTQKCPELEKIKTLINQNFTKSQEWESFKLYFEEVHPRFFRALKQKSSEFSQGELKLCAYLRIGLSTKEIATILHINVTSVNKKRNRVRKKLGIKPKENIHTFLSVL
jgi:DNA-binding CsgD family transcriptional regulator